MQLQYLVVLFKANPMVNILVALWLFTLSPSIAAAAEYYVDGAVASEPGLGTAAEPFHSFHSISSELVGGDTLIVLAGRYTEPLIIHGSGAPNLPIKIIGQGKPLIETWEDPIQIAGSYIELSGFEAHALGPGSAISVSERNHHVRISENIARDSGCAGIGFGKTDYVVVEHNTVFGNSRRSPWQCSGISLYQPLNFDHESGIHNLIARNIVYDNMDILVDDAITHSAGKTTDGNGIILDDGRHTQGSLNEPAYDGETLIENNIVFDNGGRGVHVFNSDHVLVRNNTSFHNLKDTNISGREDQAEFMALFAGDVRFVNNIAVPRASTFGGYVASKIDRAFVWDFNLIAGGRPASFWQAGAGSHNIVEPENHNFVMPSTDPNVADFHLLPDSRAVGAGDVHNAPSDDFSGRSRPKGGPIDLGALQISGMQR